MNKLLLTGNTLSLVKEIRQQIDRPDKSYIKHKDGTIDSVYNFRLMDDPRPRRRPDEGELAECPLCGSLDIGGATNTVNCYGCGLAIIKPPPLQNAIDAWNMRNGESLDIPEGLKEE